MQRKISTLASDWPIGGQKCFWLAKNADCSHSYKLGSQVIMSRAEQSNISSPCLTWLSPCIFYEINSVFNSTLVMISRLVWHQPQLAITGANKTQTVAAVTRLSPVRPWPGTEQHLWLCLIFQIFQQSNFGENVWNIGCLDIFIWGVMMSDWVWQIDV